MNTNINKGCLKFFIIFFLIFFVVLIVGTIYAIQNPEVYSRSTFQGVTEVTSEQEDQILDVLYKCGIKEIDSIKADESLNDINKDGEKGYRISSDGINNIILYLNSDNTVNLVRYADHNLYAKGKVVSTLSDYTFTLNEESDLQISCEKAVKEILKSPSTAKFPNIYKWNLIKEKDKIIVQSYVDSQNSFGAELRSEFQFTLTSDDYTIVSFIFDGKELLK
jgi:hypothetical protein